MKRAAYCCHACCQGDWQVVEQGLWQEWDQRGHDVKNGQATF